MVPPAEKLPPKLKALAYVNAIEVTHARFDRDINELIEYLTPLSGIKKRRRMIALGLGVVVMVAVTIRVVGLLIGGGGA